MPLTFPSHAAAVLPVKLAAPRRWDGVALVIGSAAPDLPYACAPYLRLNAHTLPALVWFCVPVALVGAWLIRRCAPTVAAHLPPLRHFAVRDYQVLGLVRHRWQVTLISACVGALTHLLWDSFTHPRGPDLDLSTAGSGRATPTSSASGCLSSRLPLCWPALPPPAWLARAYCHDRLPWHVVTIFRRQMPR